MPRGRQPAEELMFVCVFKQHYRIHMSIGNSKNYLGISAIIAISVAVLADISLRLPRKLFIFIIKNILDRIKVSKNTLI